MREAMSPVQYTSIFSTKPCASAHPAQQPAVFTAFKGCISCFLFLDSRIQHPRGGIGQRLVARRSSHTAISDTHAGFQENTRPPDTHAALSGSAPQVVEREHNLIVR
ncbi:MAG: hypothetical protein ABI690_14310 [Chloroflexota bacterium]